MFSVKNDQTKNSVKSRNRLTLPNRQLFTNPLSEKKPTGSIARDIPSDLVYYSNDISDWILISGGSGIAGSTGETGATGPSGESGPTGSVGATGINRDPPITGLVDGACSGVAAGVAGGA